MKKFHPTTIILIGALVCCTLNALAQPLPYRDSYFLTVTFQTTQETIDRLVPEPFVPGNDGIIIFNMGELRIEGSFSYNELFIYIPVELNGKQGYYVPYLFMDNFTGIVYGREVWGFNKVMASFDKFKTENGLRFICSVSDQKLFEVDYTYGQELPVPEMPEGTFFLWKRIPSVEGGAYDVDEINSVIFEYRKIHSWQQGEARVSFYNINDGMGEIPVLRVIDATYSVRDFDLPFGHTEVDFLHL